MDKNAMYNIGYGLYVLTASENGKDNGCIVNTLMQVTSSPLVVVLGVNKQNYTHDMIAHTGNFNISMLTQQTPFDVIKHFGFQSGKEVNKFENCTESMRSDNGVLYVPKYTNAMLSGKVLEQLDFGTHTLFKAEVTDAKVLSDVPSLTYAYYQSNIKPKPQPKTEAKTAWRCKICGYIYEGETLPPDFVCPICKHGADDFEKV